MSAAPESNAISTPPAWAQGPSFRPYAVGEDGAPAAGSVPVSVTIITRNEAQRLEACLASVAFAADVVVVDAMSSDGTADLAQRLGARTFRRPWPGFTAQRNYSLTQCRYDWVLSVDADERVSLELAQSLAALMASQPGDSAYRVPEINNYFGRWLRHGGIYPGYHVSFFDRRRHSYQSGPGDVHEDVLVQDSGVLRGHMLHWAYPDFHLALQKLNFYTDLEARSRVGRGAPVGLVALLRRPLGRFFTNYVLKAGFLDGLQGFLYCVLTGLYAFSYTVKIWELQRQPRAHAVGAEEAPPVAAVRMGKSRI